MDDAIFKIPTPLMLDKVVTALDEIYAQMAQLRDGDVRGDVYEFLLSKIATAGVNGQFRTPRHIIKMMVELMAPVQTRSSATQPAAPPVSWWRRGST